MHVDVNGRLVHIVDVGVSMDADNRRKYLRPLHDPLNDVRESARRVLIHSCHIDSVNTNIDSTRNIFSLTSISGRD